MGCSQFVSQKSSDVIRATLISLFKGNQATITLVEQEYPLVIASFMDDVAGFALVDERSHDCYESAYRAFKTLYRENQNKWAERNLSFIICRSGTSPIEDAFFNQIVADIYFCRKYVISFSNQIEALRRELELLPFIPLPKGKNGGIIRPPSAQTLLHQMGIDATWSRRIVHPHEYSVSRFIRDCVKDEIGLPPKILNENEPEDRPTAELPSVARLKSLEIESFRAYKKKQTFDMDADIVVLYGPNGLGKTSFFDAIDFVCTGRIGHLNIGRRHTPSELCHLMCHLDADPQHAAVALDIEKDLKQSRLVRRLPEWDNAFINDKPIDRKSVLCFLSSPDWSEETPRVDVIERLFRASHLFSQSEQEFFEKFPTQSTIPSELVSRMLALDDYASAIKKVNDIVEALGHEIEERKAGITKAQAQMYALQSDISCIQPAETTQQPTASMMDLAAEVRDSLKKQRPKDDLQKDLSVSTTRDWRSLITADVESVKSRLSSLRLLLHLATDQVKGQAEAILLRKQMLAAQKDIDEKVALYNDLQRQLQVAINDCQNQEASMLVANKDADNLKKHLECLAQERTLLSTEQLAIKKISTLKDLVKRADKEEEGIRAELDRISSSKADIENKTVVAKESSRLWTAVAEGLRKHQVAHRELPNLQDRLNHIQNAVRAAKEAHAYGKKNLATIKQQFLDLDQLYQRATAGEQDLVRLLDQIESHVKDGICPTCGSVHTNKEVLIEKIRNRKTQRPMEVRNIAAKHAETKDSIARISDENSALEARITQLQEEERAVSKEINMIKEVWAGVAVAASQLGVDIERTEADALSEASRTRSASLVFDLISTLKSIDSGLLIVKQRAQQNVATKKDLSSQMAQAEKELRDLKSQISAIKTKRATHGIPIDWDESTIGKQYEEKIVVEVRAKQNYENANKYKNDLERAALNYEKTISSAKLVMENILQKSRAIDDERSHLVAELALFGLPATATTNDIQRELSSATDKLAFLKTLLDKIHFLEIALDANSRSVQISQLQTSIHRLQEDRKGLNDTKNRLEDRCRVFSSILRGLKIYQDRTIKSHVEGYGPLTSVIQQRLRTVYGFGSVRLSAHASEIAIDIQRGNAFEKPSDYFSDSQKQILMLSLFLAGRLTQTWSGFAPILLDDPVTHFDDLNAYAFVELIRGLLEIKPRRHQFIISTCEERLFALMHRKFQSKNNRAIFYQFKAIGDSGPVIEAL